MPNYELLSWDTQFFGFGVARVADFDGPLGLGAIVDSLRQEGVRVAYLTAAPADQARHSALLAAGAQLVDEKVTYTRATLGHMPTPSPQVALYAGRADEEELLAIACQAGEHSRFRVDANFGPLACDRLYRQWIRNDASGQSGSRVYVYRLGAAIAGLVTLRDSGPIGTIGLIGVSAQHRGQRIGSALMGQAMAHFQQRGTPHIDVVTQRANALACRFYQKHGFEVKSVVNYYHLWL